MELTWRKLVGYLLTAKETVFIYGSKILGFFVTPIGVLLEAEIRADSWFIELINWFSDAFSLDILHLTPLGFMLGSTIPLIIVFTIYRYVKQ